MASSKKPSPPNPPNPPIPLEVPVFNEGDALKAARLGAKRIELNETGSYAVGGLTPSMKMFRTVARDCECGVRVMIRPRGAPRFEPDFIYTDEEIEVMAASIRAFKNTGLMRQLRGDGFVFGVLKYHDSPDDRKFDIDVDRCRILREAASPFPCVFHRAFDTISASPRYKQGYRQLSYLGMDGILTSAGPGLYADNLDLLLRLMQCESDELTTGASSRLQIVVGGGVRSRNLERPLNYLRKFDYSNIWFHSSCITGPEEQLNEYEVMATARRLGLDLVD